ncbi:MAG: hypothetical protein JW751_32650 [Polyangiaceae bacterium]|nr:hypothetical protein [Polyangiaceae bacterium]
MQQLELVGHRGLGVRSGGGRWRTFTVALLAALAVTCCGNEGSEAGADGGTGASSGGSSLGGSSEDGDDGGEDTGGVVGAGGDAGENGSGGFLTGGPTTGGAGGSGGAASTDGTIPTGGAVEPCEPAALEDWEPPDYVAARADPGACTTAQIQRYYDDCLVDASCADFEEGGDDEDCGACLAPTPLGAASWGPILELNARPFYRWESNLAGCIELLGESDCAEKIAAAQACAREVCTIGCGLTHPDYSACIEEARASECAEYEAAAVCIMDPQHVEQCSGSGFEGLVLAYGEVFCG